MADGCIVVTLLLIQISGSEPERERRPQRMASHDVPAMYIIF